MERTHLAVLSVGLAGCSGLAPSDGPNAQMDDSDMPTAPAEGTLEVHYINVGQAASTGPPYDVFAGG